jgi:20S proteasome subunit beta 2
MKTGTTIAGIVFKDGVVLGADTRATGGTEVADKNCEKIHYLAPNIYCCGAGTAADTEKTTELIRWGRESEPRRLIFMLDVLHTL